MIGVIDTSVVLKWYVRENDSAIAKPLLGLELAAPDIILVELANALWKKVHKGEIESLQASEALNHLAEAVKLAPSSILIDEAFSLAVDLLHPVYDCLFIILSRELGVPLITADDRLCRRAQTFGLGDMVMPLNKWEERLV